MNSRMHSCVSEYANLPVVGEKEHRIGSNDGRLFGDILNKAQQFAFCRHLSIKTMPVVGVLVVIKQYADDVVVCIHHAFYGAEMLVFIRYFDQSLQNDVQFLVEMDEVRLAVVQADADKQALPLRVGKDVVDAVKCLLLVDGCRFQQFAVSRNLEEFSASGNGVQMVTDGVYGYNVAAVGGFDDTTWHHRFVVAWVNTKKVFSRLANGVMKSHQTK